MSYDKCHKQRTFIYCTSLTFPTINKTKSEIYTLFVDRSDVINTSLKWFQIHSEPISKDESRPQKQTSEFIRLF